MKIYFLSTLSLGIDVLNLLKNKFKISGVIGLSERQVGDSISGYCYMAKYCAENGLDFVEVDSYSLNTENDKNKLLSLNIDFLIVTGWQRLIPKWLINHVKKVTVGLHGSPYGITLGRGRSPQNWALILGKKEFFLSTFKIDSGIDSGEIITEMKYEISDFDDINTLYNKLCWCASEMIEKLLKEWDSPKNQITSQDSTPQYFPQRLPEDGELDWNRSTVDIYNFIRALSHPYPGAFCKLDQSETKIIIWKARPFEPGYKISGKAGQILKIYSNGDLLVKTQDSSIHIDEYTISGNNIELKEGLQFHSVNFKQQLNHIIQRHQTKYPSLNICTDLIELAK